ncbi:MAG: hypothetical protein HFI33_04435 [Lachnospiraceae bacterium]|nr:hypothetical protein [Lachnospiraceae bacterium]
MQKANERKITQLTDDKQKYLTVIETLQNGLDDTQMSFDVTSLERAINTRQDEIKRILGDIAKSRSELVEAEDYEQEISEIFTVF